MSCHELELHFSFSQHNQQSQCCPVCCKTRELKFLSISIWRHIPRIFTLRPTEAPYRAATLTNFEQPLFIRHNVALQRWHMWPTCNTWTHWQLLAYIMNNFEWVNIFNKWQWCWNTIIVKCIICFYSLTTIFVIFTS